MLSFLKVCFKRNDPAPAAPARPRSLCRPCRTFMKILRSAFLKMQQKFVVVFKSQFNLERRTEMLKQRYLVAFVIWHVHHSLVCVCACGNCKMCRWKFTPLVDILICETHLGVLCDFLLGEPANRHRRLLQTYLWSFLAQKLFDIFYKRIVDRR